MKVFVTYECELRTRVPTMLAAQYLKALSIPDMKLADKVANELMACAIGDLVRQDAWVMDLGVYSDRVVQRVNARSTALFKARISVPIWLDDNESLTDGILNIPRFFEDTRIERAVATSVSCYTVDGCLCEDIPPMEIPATTDEWEWGDRPSAGSRDSQTPAITLTPLPKPFTGGA